MVTRVDIELARRDLNGLIELVSAGGEVLIADGDTPVARLTGIAVAEQTQRVAGLHPDAAWTSDDFDARLPDEFWGSAA